MESKFIELVEILREIRSRVNCEDCHICWSQYNSVKELIDDLDNYIEKLKQKDRSVIKDLVLLFAPTGSFQEISISNGWGMEFIELSRKFDELTR